MADAISDQDQRRGGRGPCRGRRPCQSQSMVRRAPQALNQPINPGWSFGNITVNNVNSSAPDVERDVVSRHSYGRQIGRLMDAVAALADEVTEGRRRQTHPAVSRAGRGSR